MKTIYHVVNGDSTMTLLTKEELDNYLFDSESGYIVCESQVTETVYGQLVEWRLTL